MRSRLYYIVPAIPEVPMDLSENGSNRYTSHS